MRSEDVDDCVEKLTGVYAKELNLYPIKARERLFSKFDIQLVTPYEGDLDDPIEMEFPQRFAIGHRGNGAAIITLLKTINESTPNLNSLNFHLICYIFVLISYIT